MVLNETPNQFEVYEAVDLAIIVMEVGADGLPRYVMNNSAAREISGLPHEAYLGKTPKELYGGAMGERALAQQLAVIEAAKETSYEITMPRVHRTRYLRTTMKPLFDEDGRVTHLVGSITDVTSERELDAALELAKIARDKAEEASRAQERFLANMSHEIRTPMNGVLGMCELLLETELDTQQKQFATTIHSSAGELLEIINDILDFSSIKAEKIALNATAFSLRTLIRNIGDLLWARAAFKGVDLRTSVADTLPEIFVGDAGKLRQILINLVGNAIKFTTSGHIELSATYDPDHQEHPVCIRVSDTGVGIADDRLDTIFAAFVQVDSTTTREVEGTGLGLAITKALVERMDGKVAVTSALDVGSTFSVHLNLPVKDVVEGASDPKDAAHLNGTVPKLSPGSNPDAVGSTIEGMNVLVAEDNRTNQLVIKKMLAASGAELHFTSDGLQAVNAYKEQSWDLVLMDLSMPLLGGLEATRMIREYEKDAQKPACRIVALTANAQPSDAEACYAAGMNGFMTKPFRKADLIALLHS